jgi:hypothetical protein
MKTPLVILGSLALLLAALYLFAPRPDPAEAGPRTDLPWQAVVEPDGTVAVLGIVLGRSTLADALASFGRVRGLAVFEGGAGDLALEAYFGTVRFGLLEAKVVATLDCSRQELEGLKGRARRKKGSPTGDWKHPLGAEPDEHLGRVISGVSYMPATDDLDEAFLRERFGRPAAVRRENKRAQTWFYPDRGFTVLFDPDGREVFEFRRPGAFQLPADASPYTGGAAEGGG